MRWLTGLLVVGLLVGFVMLVIKVKGDAYWSDPSQWNRTIERTSHSTVQETGELQEYTQKDRREQTDVIGSRKIRDGVTGESQGSLFGGAQQRYDSHANYDDGREQWGSFKDSMTYKLRIKDTNGTEHDVEGLFNSQ